MTSGGSGGMVCILQTIIELLAYPLVVLYCLTHEPSSCESD